MQLIRKYFPDITREQFEKFEQMIPLYRAWNEKVNLVSRKDIDHLEEHHILHSLVIAKVWHNSPQPPLTLRGGERRVLDIGTGGGFPGIPLAILFPETRFHLIDSIGKKIAAVRDIISKMDLRNATVECIRAENVQENYDLIVSRATVDLQTLERYAQKIFQNHPTAGHDQKGVYCLKGGVLDKEIQALASPVRYSILDFFPQEYFQNKFVIRWEPRLPPAAERKRKPFETEEKIRGVFPTACIFKISIG